MQLLTKRFNTCQQFLGNNLCNAFFVACLLVSFSGRGWHFGHNVHTNMAILWVGWSMVGIGLVGILVHNLNTARNLRSQLMNHPVPFRIP